MNMEDRLKQAFENEADQMRAPGGSIEDAVRRGKRRRASRFIGGAALALTLIGGTGLAIQLAAGTGDDSDEITATNESLTPTTLAPVAPRVAAFDWERVELPVPSGTEVYNVRVQSLGGRFVALGEGFSHEEGSNQRVVWVSDNGRDWTLTPGPDGGEESGIGEIFGSEDGIIAVERGSLSNQIEVLTTRDGLDWARGTLDVSDSVAAQQFVQFTGGASGNGVYILAGIAESEPPPPPVILEEAGIVLQEGPGEEFATVSDLETGELITEVPLEVLYGGFITVGMTVHDRAGNPVVVIPDEVVEREFGEEFVIEYQGVRLVLDNNDGTYVATEIAGGALINQGDQIALYQPGAFRITHPETGAVLVDMPMEDFWLAQEQSFENFNGDYFPNSKAIVLRSEDGINWVEVELGNLNGEASQFSSLTFGSSGFLLHSFAYSGDDGTGNTLLQSNDGLTWERADNPPFSTGLGFAALDDSYYTMDYLNREGAGIVRSDDLENWERVYSFEDQSIFFNGIHAGELGLVAAGQSNSYVSPPLVVSKDGRTMILDSSAGSLVVTDDESGGVLANISFDIYNEGPPAGIVELEDDDGFQIVSDGVVIMTIGEADMEAASPESDFEEFNPELVVLFSSDGDDWSRVSTAGLNVGYLSGVAVGAEVVVISGEPIYQGSQGSITLTYGSETVTTLIDGRLSSGGLIELDSEGPAPPFVWVGTPR